MAPSAPGSISDIVQRLQLWIQRQSSGLAKVEYSSEFSRQAVLGKLQPTLKQQGMPLYEIALPRYQAPGAITDFLNQELDKYPSGLVSITGFTTAFDTKVPLADALRQLNMNRERLAHRPLQQIWWMLPIFSQNSLLGMPDLTSWFLPRLRLTEALTPQQPQGELMNPEGTASNFDDARQRAYSLIERFQQAYAAGANTQELLETYLLPALEALAEVNAYQELKAVTSEFAGLLTALQDSDSPELLNALNQLALLYYRQGRYSEATPLLKRTLTQRQQSLGPDHPHTATSLNNLAALYESMGRYGEAEPLYARSLVIREAQLGPDHPDTATSLNNLAALYESMGRYGEAEPLYARSLEIREAQLGPDHPSTATSLNNLAGLYKSMGRYGEAEPLYARALEIREAQLGPEHPDTATSLNNLAGLYKSMGRYGEAEPLYARSLEICAAQLGPDHPRTAASLNNLALLCDSMNRYEEAESHYLQSLEIQQKVLPSGHPSIKQVIKNFGTFLQRMIKIDQTKQLSRHPITQAFLKTLESNSELPIPNSELPSPDS
ncbi:MAG: tetratricopeptide repeat protein [Cyanobacteria bacterium J06638_20]